MPTPIATAARSFPSVFIELRDRDQLILKQATHNAKYTVTIDLEPIGIAYNRRISEFNVRRLVNLENLSSRKFDSKTTAAGAVAAGSKWPRALQIENTLVDLPTPSLSQASLMGARQPR